MAPFILNRGAYGGGWLISRAGRFTPGKDPVPSVQEAGWALGPVWTGAENLAPTGIRSPDRPARSESLYRLSYRGTTNAPILTGLDALEKSLWRLQRIEPRSLSRTAPTNCTLIWVLRSAVIFDVMEHSQLSRAWVQIKSRLQSGNACYHSAQNLLSSSLLSKNEKIKIYRIVILSVILYGCEIWSLTLREERGLWVFEENIWA